MKAGDLVRLTDVSGSFMVKDDKIIKYWFTRDSLSDVYKLVSIGKPTSDDAVIQNIHGENILINSKYLRLLKTDLTIDHDGYMFDVLRKSGTARMSRWHTDTHIFFKSNTLKIKFGNTGIIRDFIPNKNEIMTCDWVPFVEKKEKCLTCQIIEKYNKDMSKQVIDCGYTIPITNHAMVDHIVDFHPCTCKK